MTRLGILCALPQEARVISTGTEVGEVAHLAHDIFLVRSGIGEDNAAAGARSLLAADADALISFGFCGALDPVLQPGDIVLPDVVTDKKDRFAVSMSWRDAMMSVLGISTGSILLLHSSHPLADKADKQAAFASTGASATDMESIAIARAADNTGKPFLVIRVVVDDAAASLPKSALSATDQWGHTDSSKLLWGLLRNPGEITDVVRLAMCMRKALNAMNRVTKKAGPQFARENAQ